MQKFYEHITQVNTGILTEPGKLTTSVLAMQAGT